MEGMTVTVGTNAGGVGVWGWVLFFFQAEDGIRDLTVTGVQTCALPISGHAAPSAWWRRRRSACRDDSEAGAGRGNRARASACGPAHSRVRRRSRPPGEDRKSVV